MQDTDTVCGCRYLIQTLWWSETGWAATHQTESPDSSCWDQDPLKIQSYTRVITEGSRLRRRSVFRVRKAEVAGLGNDEAHLVPSYSGLAHGTSIDFNVGFSCLFRCGLAYKVPTKLAKSCAPEGLLGAARRTFRRENSTLSELPKMNPCFRAHIMPDNCEKFSNSFSLIHFQDGHRDGELFLGFCGERGTRIRGHAPPRAQSHRFRRWDGR